MEEMLGNLTYKLLEISWSTDHDFEKSFAQLGWQAKQPTYFRGNLLYMFGNCYQEQFSVLENKKTWKHVRVSIIPKTDFWLFFLKKDIFWWHIFIVF